MCVCVCIHVPSSQTCQNFRHCLGPSYASKKLEFCKTRVFKKHDLFHPTHKKLEFCTTRVVLEQPDERKSAGWVEQKLEFLLLCPAVSHSNSRLMKFNNYHTNETKWMHIWYLWMISCRSHHFVLKNMLKWLSNSTKTWKNCLFLKQPLTWQNDHKILIFTDSDRQILNL